MNDGCKLDCKLSDDGEEGFDVALEIVHMTWPFLPDPIKAAIMAMIESLLEDDAEEAGQGVYAPDEQTGPR